MDDKSSDDTLGALQRLFGQRANHRIVRHPRNLGVAGAIGTGLAAAETEIVCSIDCDCTYDPHVLAEMIPLLAAEVDLVTASPYHPRGSVRNLPAWRLSLSRTLSRLYRLVLRHKLHTYTSCFRVYRRERVLQVGVRNTDFLGHRRIARQGGPGGRGHRGIPGHPAGADAGPLQDASTEDDPGASRPPGSPHRRSPYGQTGKAAADRGDGQRSRSRGRRGAAECLTSV